MLSEWLMLGDTIGHGYGDGYGYGYGSGGGHGGSGSGYGYDVYGDGDGHGGYGYGDGDGYGEVVGVVDGYDVVCLAPWPYVRVGCRVHTLVYWREHWPDVAAADGVDVTPEQIEAIYTSVCELCKNSGVA